MRSKSRLSRKTWAVASAEPKNPSCMNSRMMAKPTPPTATRVRTFWCSKFRRARGRFIRTFRARAVWKRVNGSANGSRGGGGVGVDFHPDLVVDQVGHPLAALLVEPDFNLEHPPVHIR